MKKITLSLSALILLTACGSGLISPLGRNARISDDEAILIGKISITPMVDDSGYITTDLDDGYLGAFLTFSSPDVTSATDKDDDTMINSFKSVETNNYFAVPISITDKNLTLNDIQFVISRQRWFSNTEYIYRSFLTQVQFPIKQNLKAGEVYYMGDIEIKLNKQSFAKDEDEEDGRSIDEIEYIAPENITYKYKKSGADNWVKEKQKRITKPVHDLEITPNESGTSDRYRVTQITTTTHYR